MNTKMTASRFSIVPASKRLAAVALVLFGLSQCAAAQPYRRGENDSPSQRLSVQQFGSGRTEKRSARVSDDDGDAAEKLTERQQAARDALKRQFQQENNAAAQAGADDAVTVLKVSERYFPNIANKSVESAKFSPDGKKVVTIYDGGHYPARIWDAETGKELRDIVGEDGRATARVAYFFPNGEKIATYHNNGINSGYRFWDAATSREFFLDKAQDFYSSSAKKIAFSPDSKRIALLGRKAAWIWTDTGKYICKTPDGDAGNDDISVLFSGDGSRLIIVNETRALSYTFNARTGVSVGDPKQWVAPDPRNLSPDETKELTRTGNVVTVWDAADKTEIVKLALHSDKVNSACFSPDSTKVLTASDDKTARIWDLSKLVKLYAKEQQQRAERDKARIAAEQELKIKQENERAEFEKERRTRVEDGLKRQQKEQARRETEEKTRRAIQQQAEEARLAKEKQRREEILAIEKQIKDEWEEKYSSGKPVELGQTLFYTGFFDRFRQQGTIPYTAYYKGLDNPLVSFLQFGTRDLQEKHGKSDAFDKADVQTQIEEKQKEIRSKKFIFMLPPYEEKNVEVGKTPTGIASWFFSSKSSAELKIFLRNDMSLSFPKVWFYGGTNFLKFEGVKIVNKETISGLTLTVSGKTDTIKKLVRLKDDYAVQITIGNCRWEQRQVMADILEVQIVEIIVEVEKMLKSLHLDLEQELPPLEEIREMRSKMRKAMSELEQNR
ncbi:MAG: hypothetical protein LBT46_08600 [Planctomycetaceae bacterium]|jgi:hypothetical protein|nr:hypothetical protein [Planctomycetaceae bacterium]